MYTHVQIHVAEASSAKSDGRSMGREKNGKVAAIGVVMRGGDWANKDGDDKHDKKATEEEEEEEEEKDEEPVPEHEHDPLPDGRKKPPPGGGGGRGPSPLFPTPWRFLWPARPVDPNAEGWKKELCRLLRGCTCTRMFAANTQRQVCT